MTDPTTPSAHPAPPPYSGAVDAEWRAGEEQDRGGEQAPRQHRERSFFAELPFLVLVAFILALLLKTFLVQAFYIPSSSMEPTLLIGDRVLVNKVVYRLREPARGEVVVFSEDNAAAVPLAEPANPVVRFLRSLAAGLGLTQPGEKDFIKRIIGLPGETIEMRAGVVHINGRALPEAAHDEGGYLSTRDLNDFGPTQIPEGHYFMMGDNRPNSADSRFSLGPIAREHIVGRAFVVIWPLARAKALSPPGYEGVEESVASARRLHEADARTAAARGTAAGDGPARDAAAAA